MKGECKYKLGLLANAIMNDKKTPFSAHFEAKNGVYTEGVFFSVNPLSK